MDAAGGEEARAGGGHAKTMLRLGALFGLWHLFTGYSKQVLKAFPYPINVTAVQFAVGSVVALLMWTTGILKRPKVSGAQLASILPLAIAHTMANVFTNMSPGKVAVSFTHVDKAHRELKPTLPVLLPTFLGQLLIPLVVLCLVAIVTFQSRKVMRGSLGAINFFSVITVMSFFLLTPVTFLTEGVQVTHLQDCTPCLMCVWFELKTDIQRNDLCCLMHYASMGTNRYDTSKGVTIEENFIRHKAKAARSHFEEN